MIEASYTLDIDVGVDEVWSFVEVIPNWAHFLVGFQKLDLVDDRRSIWTLRGDVGVLAREVDLQADITVWEPGRRAEFTITGLTERITGQGSFDIEPVDAPSVPGAAAAVGPTDGSPTDGSPTDGSPASGEQRRPERGDEQTRPGLLRRIRFAVAGRLLRWLNRRRATHPPAVDGQQAGPTAGHGQPAAATGAAAVGREAGPPTSARTGRSRLRFHLQLTPGGPMAPMVELLMGPMVEPTAEDFLRNIRQALEARRASA
ncbi:hypothetical protein O7543_03165 [Solwaraspora sp. WMMA2080]|uniref:hypothetical protein n=1 Tax=unclassified Solwaraspora TaxID=2627926 RepID=UPI00248C1638|nr:MULTISPECIES: hypothetical protein [unclassified Solwaraspora]WBB99955.1 hypothetical protein O7553_14205 [Solwaraspora sp. WMMA2059]WBC21498.1 hypothetical protein O7543_03165 [Solwaraspora sp. WMMA2080]